MDRLARSFDEPDELIELDGVRSAMITQGGVTVSYDVHQPGWRWSTHVRPIVRTEWCEVHHLGIVVSGRLQVQLQDGTEFEIGPMSFMDIPPHHDAWVLGDEPVTGFAWTGVREWLEPLQDLNERVLATLLFTDLVDSTARARAVGRRAWADLLATYEQRSRDVVTRFRGRVVKTTGDGMLAQFDGAARAVRAAAVLRSAVSELGLEMRSAVHTGEVDVVGDDLRGLAIHEASRVLALAGGGEILVSETTAGLIGDAGFQLEDRGVHELRGIGGPRRIWAVA